MSLSDSLVSLSSFGTGVFGGASVSAESSPISVVSTPEVVYNVESEGKKVTNIEMYSVTDGKYLNRLCKIDFSYDEEGDVVDKKTYVWDVKNSEYVLKQTETFTK